MPMSVYKQYGDQIPGWIRSGLTLQQMGNLTGITREGMRIIIKKHYPDVHSLFLTEKDASAVLGISSYQLVKLRKAGKISPARNGKTWHYASKDIKKAFVELSSRTCALCGEIRPTGNYRYCDKCGKATQKNRWPILSPEQKETATKRNLAWQKQNPERCAIINRRAGKRYRDKLRHKRLNQSINTATD